MEHNCSSQANSHSASQEIPRLLWNPKVHYRIHMSQPLVLTSAIRIQSTCLILFPYIQSNIILPSTPMYSEWSLIFGFNILNHTYLIKRKGKVKVILVLF
jgi:hypothetical protein